MSLRARVTLTLAALSVVATLLVGGWSYRTTASRLDAEIDRSLQVAVRSVQGLPRGGRLDPALRPPALAGDADGELLVGGQLVVQVVDPDGRIARGAGPVELPVGSEEAELAASATLIGQVWRDVTVDGEPYRMVTVPLARRIDGPPGAPPQEGGTPQSGASPDGAPRGGALQAGRSLEERDRLLADLRQRTLAVVLVTTGAAVVAGAFIARRSTRRLTQLTAVAEQVAATGDLRVNVATDGRDEAGRLGAAFDEMLRALASSRHAQERLVADAGHELRTPLTSLRANLAILARHPDLPADQRREILEDLEAETRELSALADELMALATHESSGSGAALQGSVEPLTLAEVAEQAGDAARRRTGRTVVVRADTSVAVADRVGVERAMTNLLANAAKFDPDGSEPIELSVQNGRVEVCDRGPGIDDVDLPHVFERFYRAVGSRSAPGSGLGLAIVADVARHHGGDVWAANRPSGGACVGFWLPTEDSHRALTQDRAGPHPQP